MNTIDPTNPATYGIEDQDGELIEGKYYEQEYLKSVFFFYSNQKVLKYEYISSI